MNEPTRAKNWRNRIEATVATGYAWLVAAFLVHATYAAFWPHFSSPHGDDWRILDDFFSSPSLAAWIWTDQNGHRMPVTLSLLYFDYTFFLGKMHLLVAASLLCTWLTVGALYAGFRADDDSTSPAAKVTLAFASYCVFWAGGCFDLVWGAMQGRPLSVMSLCFALAFLALYGKHLRQAAERDRRLPFASALAAVVATFSQGMGVATWAALGALSILGRFPVRVLFSFLIGATASVGLYSYGIRHQTASLGWYVTLLSKRPLDVLEFVAAFIGGPVLHAALGLGWAEDRPLHGLAVGAGALGVVGLLVYSSWLLARPARLRGRDLLALGLMLFALAGGALIAVNRLPFPSSATSIRFISWSALFWMGAAIRVGSLTRDSRRSSLFVTLLFPLLSVLMLPALLDARIRLETLRQLDRVSAAMHLSGIRWDNRARFGMYPSSDPVYRVVDQLRRNRRSFFADGWGDLPGSSVDERFREAPANRCSGTIKRFYPIKARGGAAAEVYGWGWNHADDRAPQIVVIADAARIVKGVGLFFPEPYGRHLVGGAKPDGAPWVGYINQFDPAQRYIAYGVLDDGVTICQLAARQPP
jgi:hypothetical protein